MTEISFDHIEHVRFPVQWARFPSPIVLVGTLIYNGFKRFSTIYISLFTCNERFVGTPYACDQFTSIDSSTPICHGCSHPG